MKKYYFLIIVALILSLALTGCTLLSNVGQVPATEQSGISYSTKGPSFTVGNDDTVRPNIDSYHNFTIIDTNNPSSALGLLTTFSYYAANSNPFRFVLVDESDVVQWVSAEITPSAPAPGVKSWIPSTPVYVEPDWNLGLYFALAGTVTWEYAGAPAWYEPNNTGLPNVGDTLSYASSSNRIYSFVATGDVCLPSIEIVKTADPTTIHAGDLVTYTYVVTNTGDCGLTVDVVDNVLGTIASDVSLAAGASETYTVTDNPEADVINIGTATGTDVIGGVDSDNDSASVDVLHPAIGVEKSGPEAAAPGDIVTYTYTMINTGDCTLYNVSLFDDVVGPIVLTGITDLAQGVQVTVSADYLVTFGDPEWLINMATASGTDELGLTVDDEASWTVHTMGARTIGYWKNHPDAWCPFPSGSMFFDKGSSDLLPYFPGSGAQIDGVNPLEMLRVQLIATELNYACFEDDFHYARYEAADIFGTMRDAEALLKRVYGAASNEDMNAFWSGLSKQQQNNIKQISNPLKDTLEEFNAMGDEIFE